MKLPGALLHPSRLVTSPGRRVFFLAFCCVYLTICWHQCIPKSSREAMKSRNSCLGKLRDSRGQDSSVFFTLNIVFLKSSRTGIEPMTLVYMTLLTICLPVAQWLERPTCVRKVMGPIPVGESDVSLSQARDILNIPSFLKHILVRRFYTTVIIVTLTICQCLSYFQELLSVGIPL